MIKLPYPPSVNSLYAGKGRRYKSKAYKAWFLEAGIAINGQTASVRGKKIKLTIRVHRPDKRVRDIANIEKAVSDLLVAHGILEDDSDIISNTQLWIDEEWEDELIIECKKT